MSKSINQLVLWSILFGLSFYQANSQDVTSNNHQDAVKEIVQNSTDILQLERISQDAKSFIKKNQLDGISLAKVTFVFKSQTVHIGDTVLIILPDIGYTNDSLIEYHPHNPYPPLWSDCKGSICGEFFLQKTDLHLDLLKSEWKIKSVFELTNSPEGFTSVNFKDATFKDPRYEVSALFGQKFKTKNDWYNYLKQFPDIKIPGEK